MSTKDNVPLADDTLRLVADARQESIRFGHPYIGMEHFLLALTRRATDSPLVDLGVDVARVQQLVEETIRRGQDPIPADWDRPFTSRTKQAFAYADEAARSLAQPRVDVDHVLYGLMREGKNIAALVLCDDGLTAELVETRIRRAANAGGPE